MTPRRWLAIAAPVLVLAIWSGAAPAQVRGPIVGPGPVAGPGPIIIDPLPRPIIIDPGPITITPPPPPPPPPPCTVTGTCNTPTPLPCVGSNCSAQAPPTPLGGGNANISSPSLISPTDGVLAATGVPIGPNDRQDDPLAGAIHKQWLGYLQSIQAAHQDKHWQNPPYDDWLQRHPEDRGVIPAVADAQNNPQPSAIAVTATPLSEPSNSTPPPPAPGIDKNLVGILVGGIAVATYAAMLWRRKRKGR
jgi:hypothetical protein